MKRQDLKGLLPREHGSWAYLLGPQVATLIASTRPGPAALWLAGSLLLFCAFQAFAAALRRKERASPAGAVAGVGGLALATLAARGMPAVLLTLAPGLLPALMGIFMMRGRLGRHGRIEVLGIIALCVQGAGGLRLGGGDLPAASLLAIASCAYFLQSLIWVRVRLGSEIPGRSPLLPRGWNLPVSLGLLFASAVVGILIRHPVAGLLPGLYPARALLPVPRRPDGRLRIPRLGVEEAAVASLFAVGLGLFLPA